MKKIVISILALFLICSCGNKSLKVEDLSINDFKYKSVESKCYGLDCYTFSLENNSKYDIIGIQVIYKVKDNVTLGDLSVYDSFMDEHSSYIDDDASLKDITLIGEKNTMALNGETIKDIPINIGYKDLSWYSSPTSEQFKLMELSELQIGLVGKDNKLYIAYYDFINKTWKLDSEIKDIDTWSDSKISNKIEKPSDKHHIITRDKDDCFSFYSYGVTKDAFKKYVEKIKSLGFVDEYPSDSKYYGENAEGYLINIEYSEENQRMYVRIEN